MPRLTTGKHNVEVLRASFTEAQSGTAGIYLEFGNEEGDIDHTLWITPKTRDRAIETLGILGVDSAAIDDFGAICRIEDLIRGNWVSVVCEEEEYRGKWQVKVKWINPVRAEASADLKSRIYGALSGKRAPVNGPAAPPPAKRPPLPPASEPPPNYPFDDSDNVPF